MSALLRLNSPLLEECPAEIGGLLSSFFHIIEEKEVHLCEKSINI
jgi:hypothetical protein